MLMIQPSTDTYFLAGVQIESLPPLRVACLRFISPTPEDDWKKFMADCNALQNLPGPGRNFGFDIDVSSEQQKAGCRGYEFWYVVPDSFEPIESITIRNFEGGKYATLTLHKPFVDPYKFIPDGWKELHEWVIRSDHYRVASHQWLEELIPHPEGDDLKLYHPVTRA